MPKTSNTKLPTEEIGEKASCGEDVSAYFTNEFTVVRPIRRVNVDLTEGMAREIDEQAARINVSQEAMIKFLLAKAPKEKHLNKSRSDRKAFRLALASQE